MYLPDLAAPNLSLRPLASFIAFARDASSIKRPPRDMSREWSHTAVFSAMRALEELEVDVVGPVVEECSSSKVAFRFDF